jgi:hypothetical protein
LDSLKKCWYHQVNELAVNDRMVAWH